MNNYSDYYNYMNYMNNSTGVSGGIPSVNYQELSNNSGYSSIDNNTFINNFMTPLENSELLMPSEGLEKGNLFKNAYKPYKNYKPMVVGAKTERGKLLNQILDYRFAMNELNLYLDLYPNNSNYINLYNEYRKISDNLCANYERMYGPLNLDSNSLDSSNVWLWNNGPWPWEGEK